MHSSVDRALAKFTTKEKRSLPSCASQSWSEWQIWCLNCRSTPCSSAQLLLETRQEARHLGLKNFGSHKHGDMKQTYIWPSGEVWTFCWTLVVVVLQASFSSSQPLASPTPASWTPPSHEATPDPSWWLLEYNIVSLILNGNFRLPMIRKPARGSYRETNKKQCSRQLQCEVPCTVQQPLQVTILLKWGGGGGRGGLGGGWGLGGQGTFHPPCHIQHYHMVLALKGLRTMSSNGDWSNLWEWQYMYTLKCGVRQTTTRVGGAGGHEQPKWKLYQNPRRKHQGAERANLEQKVQIQESKLCNTTSGRLCPSADLFQSHDTPRWKGAETES